jgi:hypothetical protein
LSLQVFDQRGDHAPVDAALVGAGEQGVLAVEGDGTDGALDHVGIDLDPAVVEEDGKPGPELEGVADRFSDTRAAGDLGELGVEPDPQVIDDRPTLILADGLALLGRMAAVMLSMR